MPDLREWERVTRENGVRKDRIIGLLEDALTKARDGSMGAALTNVQSAAAVMREYEDAREKAWGDLE